MGVADAWLFELAGFELIGLNELDVCCPLTGYNGFAFPELTGYTGIVETGAAGILDWTGVLFWTG